LVAGRIWPYFMEEYTMKFFLTSVSVITRRFRNHSFRPSPFFGVLVYPLSVGQCGRLCRVRCPQRYFFYSLSNVASLSDRTGFWSLEESCEKVTHPVRFHCLRSAPWQKCCSHLWYVGYLWRIKSLLILKIR
jgi:hypothetical protein